MGKLPRQGENGKFSKLWISMQFDMPDPWVLLLCFFEFRPLWGNFGPNEGDILIDPRLAHIFGTNCPILMKLCSYVIF